MEGKLTKLLTSTGRVHGKFSIICKLRQLTFLICSVAADRSLLCPPFLCQCSMVKTSISKILLEAGEPDTGPPVPLLCTIQGVMSYHNTEGSVGVIKIKILGFMVVLCNHAKMSPSLWEASRSHAKLPLPKYHSFSFLSKKVNSFDTLKSGNCHMEDLIRLF